MRIPKSPPEWGKIFLAESPALGQSLQALFTSQTRDFVRSANDRYLHWDKLRYQPLPPNLTPLLAWAAVGMSRSSQYQQIPVSFYDVGDRLKYWLPPQHLEWVSLIDQNAGGSLGTRHPRSIPDDNERYLHNSLMEEAIASSQLEGATTTREVAKEMLRTSRRPQNDAERMILNNYKAIMEIRDLKKDELTPAMLCHLQEVLTEGTLKDTAAAGRFRRSKESVVVVDVTTNDIIYTPPPADTVSERIREVCEFANSKSKPFIHPVVKAMALHFALGFIHPFVDGNGRTARAIFYWYMLKHGYWMFEYLPISRIIINAPAKYGRAYLYTETDGGDLTYFNHYHLQVVLRAIEELHKYLDEQQRRLAEADKLLDLLPDLNYRQRALVQNALKHCGHRYTAREHEGKYRVTYNTARADLHGLDDLGLFEKSKQGKGGREWIYRPAADLMRRLGTPKAKNSAKTTKMPRKTTKAKKAAKKNSSPSKRRLPTQPTLFD